jgi:hypothetical protein
MSEADDNCICKGNWRAIAKETLPLIGNKYIHTNGVEFTLFGIVNDGEDYYYGMCNDAGFTLLSCVGSIENHGYIPVND